MSRLKWIVIVSWYFLTTTIEVFSRELGRFFNPFGKHRKTILFVLVLAWLVYRITDRDMDHLSLIDDLAIGVLASLLVD
jgi:hypothetical protein